MKEKLTERENQPCSEIFHHKKGRNAKLKASSRVSVITGMELNPL